MPKNEIRIADEVFTDREIIAGSITLQASLPNDELTVDVLNVTLDGSVSAGTRFLPKGASRLRTAEQKLLSVNPQVRFLNHNPTSYSYGEPVYYYRNGGLFRKFYMSSSKRIGKYKYEIACISDIGLLDGSRHYGGVYRGILLKDLLPDIIGGVVPFTLEKALQKVAVYGWLPVATRRENLHQLLFAEGITAKRDVEGNLYFGVLTEDTPVVIGKDRMFAGGSVKHEAFATRADITEHIYTAYDSGEAVTLFDGAIAADNLVTPKGQSAVGAIILFTDPAHSLTVTGSKIIESGDNYAVLGNGTAVKLVGKNYTHMTRVVTRYPKAAEKRGLTELTDNIITVKDATLVSFPNSENVAERVIAYYGFRRAVSAGLVVGNEKPGDSISFEDPWGEVNSGFIGSLDITMSATLKARAELISGYIPALPGNYYTRSEVLKTAGEWTVPAGVRRIRVAVIGGGSGGESGESGKPGQPVKLSEQISGSARIKAYSDGISGAGGAGGAGGQAAKVYEFTLDVTPGQKFAVTVGNGGSGGGPGNRVPGSAGGDTVFGGKSSAGGTVPQNGYINILTEEVYALDSKVSGTPGGRGTGVLTDGGSVVTGNTVSGYGPGSAGAQVEDYKIPYVAVAYGGWGGGAAVGAKGGSGYVGSASVSGYTVKATGGRGGNGATPATVPAAATVPGSGGPGGHGGGGGGGSGVGSAQIRDASSGSLVPSLPGMSSGGSGGKGGSGAPGCVIVYY